MLARRITMIFWIFVKRDFRCVAAARKTVLYEVIMIFWCLWCGLFFVLNLFALSFYDKVCRE